jgi:two-component system NtrC family sensor kinase
LSFIKSLSKVNDIGELSHLLQKEVKVLSKDCEPYLAFRARDFGRWIYTVRQNRLIERSVESHWKTGARLRINDKQDQVYLANEFSKPVQKTIAVPLSSNHHQSSEVNLFIEHNLGAEDLEELIDEVGKRAQPLALCLDRALLEIELKRSAYLWESTFNSIDEPIAIVDKSLMPIRSNLAFEEKLRFWFQGLGEAEKDTANKIRLCFESGSSLSLPLMINESFFDLKLYPIMVSESREVESVVCLFVDMTHEKKLQSQMIQHEKMTAIGHLAGNIAHELNNPLAGLKSLGQILLKEIDDRNPISEDIKEILLAAERSSDIIKNLLEFSNPAEGTPVEVFELNALVAKTLPLLKSITSNFERRVVTTDQPLTVKVNPQLIQQVFFNLVNNACQAMGEKGSLSIETKMADGQALLVVSDSGGGIPEDVRAKVFDPFFSTKKERGGTGLGLSMSRNIVRSYGGEIDFESEVGVGTKFILSFPIEND